MNFAKTTNLLLLLNILTAFCVRKKYLEIVEMTFTKKQLDAISKL